MERVPVRQEVAAAAHGAPNHQDAAPNAGGDAGMMPHAALGVALANGAGNSVQDGGAGGAGLMPGHALGIAPVDEGNAVYDEDGAGMVPHAALGVAPDRARNPPHGGAGVAGMMPAHALGVAPDAAGNAADGGAGAAEMMVVVPAFDVGDIERVLREGPLLLIREGPGSLILF